MKDDEAELLQRASDIANEQDIYLLVSLLVKKPYEDLKENKVVAFPAEIRQAGKNDVDILIIPASDWKEMTPIAVKTAVFARC